MDAVGRWAGGRSLEHYLQESAAFLALRDVPSASLPVIEFLVGLYPCFERPPRRPWQRYFSRTRQIRARAASLRAALRGKGY